MAYRRRRSPTKGKHCVRRKSVRVRGGGTALRCAKFSEGRARSRSSYRRKSTTRRRSTRKPAGMAKRGSRCIRFKRVRVRGGGMQRRCAKFRAR